MPAAQWLLASIYPIAGSLGLHKIMASERMQRVGRVFRKTNRANKRRSWRRGNGSGDNLQYHQDKVLKLKRLIPGACQLHSHQLLLFQTAKYIIHLRLKINVMQALLSSSSPTYGGESNI
ncbi:hypothetical protein A4A49_19962 [Nicotiana attenuata]|uniref:BHLH domain-containing protein n=1 Tax=Nicotiana attenuata TaxID=49451 RepID=A0A1J6I9J0_NICAT|nr:hypothetical protein A4A49_19962 [Nicotiana attenuata]